MRWLLAIIILLLSLDMTAAQSSANCAAAEQRGERCIEIEASHSELVRLDKPFTSLFVGDQFIADAVAQDDRTFLLNAKQKPGRTNVIALDAQTQVVFSASIVVTSPPDPLPVGRIKIVGRNNTAHDYWIYACTVTSCVRLKEEYPGEHSKELFVPGLRLPAQINNTTISGQPSPPPPNQSAPRQGTD